MLQIVIPKDIDEYEPTLIGGLSTRKVVCGGLGLVGVYGIWMLEKSMSIESPEYVPIWAIPVVIALLFGWIKPFGMKMEKFLSTAFVSNVLAPTHRLYCSDTIDKIIEDEKYKGMSKSEISKLEKDQAKMKKKKHKMKKKNLKPEFIPYV